MKSQVQDRYQLAKKISDSLQNIPRTFRDQLTLMEEEINNHRAFESFWQCCTSRRKNKYTVDQRFLKAFRSMSMKQKLKYYEKTLKYAQPANIKIVFNFTDYQNEEIIIQQEAGFHSWSDTSAKLRNFKVVFRDGTIIDSRNYILRKSKRQPQLCYAFESINSKIQPTTFRFKYINEKDQQLYHYKLEQIFQNGHYENVKRNFKVLPELRNPRSIKNNSKQKEVQILCSNLINDNIGNENVTNLVSPTAKLLKQQKELTNALDKFVINNIIQDKVKQTTKHHRSSMKACRKSLKSPIKNYHKNIFNVIFPGMSYQQIDRVNNYKEIVVNTKMEFKIFTYYSNKYEEQKYPQKLKMKSSYTPQLLIKCLTNAFKFNLWHPCIKSGDVLMVLDSENAMLTTQINQYGPQQEQFQFFILSHCFQKDKIHYLAQKSISIQNFESKSYRKTGILRYALWKFQNIDSGCDISLEIMIDHGCEVSSVQQIQYAKLYLQHFPYVQQKFLQSVLNQSQLIGYLQSHWYILDGVNVQANNNKKLNDLQSSLFDSYSELYQDNTEDYYSIQSIQQQSKVQVKIGSDNSSIQQQNPQFLKDKNDKICHEQPIQIQALEKKNQFLKTENSQKIKSLLSANGSGNQSSIIQKFSIKLDSSGLIHVDSSYLTKKFKLQPYSETLSYQIEQKQFDNPGLKNDFKINQYGEMVLTNTDKLGKISQVMAFLTKKLFNNLLGGKSILNISLPVIICAKDSNLQRLSRGWKFAPIFLQQAGKTKSNVERLKLAIAFMLGYSVTYVNIEKPFNPILGETYQAWIKGCPIYAEQISHHPPITSLLFYGRGYRISSTLQVKVEIKLNSGKGFNQGLTKIVFDDGQTIYLTFPKGQVTGLVMGNKKFEFYQQTYIFDIENRLYLELNFSEKLGTFQKKKWKDRCQIQGTIVKTTQKFMQQFVKSTFTKKITKSDIEETLHTVSGRWLIELLIDGKKYYDVCEDLAYEVKQQPYPLPSHSNYREDLFYRKVDDQRSQREKQRLEQLQRYDKKLRQRK